ncbi:hypothetical protein V6N11_019231 [Hibiscus sabdariffa]|uniref:Uncharacterized protein n=1 Tax=Hibiscus sabdariffa TaxID=183260 RepID=A0ABR2R1U9_9ROSI
MLIYKGVLDGPQQWAAPLSHVHIQTNPVSRHDRKPEGLTPLAPRVMHSHGSNSRPVVKLKQPQPADLTPQRIGLDRLSNYKPLRVEMQLMDNNMGSFTLDSGDDLDGGIKEQDDLVKAKTYTMELSVKDHGFTYVLR